MYCVVDKFADLSVLVCSCCMSFDLSAGNSDGYLNLDNCKSDGCNAVQCSYSMSFYGGGLSRYYFDFRNGYRGYDVGKSLVFGLCIGADHQVYKCVLSDGMLGN